MATVVGFTGTMSPPVFVVKTLYPTTKTKDASTMLVTGLSNSQDSMLKSVLEDIDSQRYTDFIYTWSSSLAHLRHWYKGFGFRTFLEVNVLARYWIHKAQLTTPFQIRAVVFLAAKFVDRDFDTVEKLMHKVYGTPFRQMKQEQLDVLTKLF